MSIAHRNRSHHRSRPGRAVPRVLSAAVAAAMLAACAGAPERPPQLVRLENELSRLETDPVVASYAADELDQARDAIELIASDGRRMDSDLFDHNVHLANRLLQIAEAEGRGDAARARVDELTATRESLVADARRLEAERARREAAAARAEAMRIRDEAERARALAALAQAEAEAERREAALAREDAEAARAELEAMRSMLSDLQAKQTDRGLVVTLGDVLFEVDRAELKPGARRNLDKLVDALDEHPQTVVMIEGHTDSTGSSSYNEDLSRRRAEAVERYLVDQGVDASRLGARGLGEDYPVASNDTTAGRQQNRRVEVIIQNEDDTVAMDR